MTKIKAPTHLWPKAREINFLRAEIRHSLKRRRIKALIKAFAALVIFILVGGYLTQPVYAGGTTASLTVAPTTLSLPAGTSAQVSISINAGTASVAGSDAILSFSQSDINISNVSNGGFFPDYNYAIDTTNGRLEIHAGYLTIGDLGGNTSGNGNLATFNISTSKTSGSSTVSFVCSSSDVLDSGGNNILNCGSLNQLSLTYSSGNTNNTPTPTLNPTPTPQPTATPTPMPTATPAPANGNTAPACTGLSVSPNSGTQTLWSTLSCSGHGNNADITAAEFVFGDGKVQIVQQKIGNSGSISVLHPYTGFGAFTASCRVEDNNQLFSSGTGACQKIVTVTSLSGGNYTRGTTSTKPVAAATTPQVVALTPVPTPTVIPLPTVTPAPAKQGGVINLRDAILALIFLGIAGFLYWKFKKPSPPTPPPSSPTPFQPPIAG